MAKVIKAIRSVAAWILFLAVFLPVWLIAWKLLGRLWLFALAMPV